MAVQVAAHVAEPDELRQRAIGRGRDLPVRLPQLGLDVGEPQPPIDLGLGRVAGDRAGLGVGDAVL